MQIRVSKIFLERAEYGFTVFALLIFTQALLVSGKVPWAPVNGILRGLSWAGIYGITFFLSALRWKQLIRVATRDKFLILLLGLALISVLWSELPRLTLKKAIALVATSLFGAHFATRYNLKEQFQLLKWTYGIAALFSLVFVLVLPMYGISGAGWQGVYQQSNILGRQMIIGSIIFYLTALDSHKHRWLAWSGFIISAGLLLGTRSGAAIVTLVVVIVLLPLYRALRWNYTIAILFYITVILVSGSASAWLVNNVDAILANLGKDATLTGRVPLWDVLVQMALERPWLGYGFSAFWSEASDTTGYVNQIFEWTPPSAHSAYLDVWLSLGLIGLTVFVLGFLMCFLRAVIYVRSSKTAESLWPLAYLTVMLLFAPVQSLIPGTNSIFWVLYVAITLSMPMRRSQVSRIGVGL